MLAPTQQKGAVDRAQIKMGRRLLLPVPFSLVPRAKQTNPTTWSHLQLPTSKHPCGSQILIGKSRSRILFQTDYAHEFLEIPFALGPLGVLLGEQNLSHTFSATKRSYPRVIEFVFKVNDACTNELLSNYIEKKNQNEWAMNLMIIMRSSQWHAWFLRCNIFNEISIL